jgi:hypothetical protein
MLSNIGGKRKGFSILEIDFLEKGCRRLSFEGVLEKDLGVWYHNFAEKLIYFEGQADGIFL